MEVVSSRLNPEAPMFIPLAYRMVEDFSEEWWSLIRSSPCFRDYWLQERYFDPLFDDFLLPDDDVDALFHDHDDDYNTPASEERDVRRELVSVGKLKWNNKGSDFVKKARCFEKPPKIVNLKVSPRMIQQPR